ncbi:surface antigen BspA-like [Chaetoceros tenuissimus]|uniref:Surface antigen BspA-like n=1 Tax=Chaetoceros tenuissimus TaxID=426638 RepID=A0AAD3H919_9STRA|nr:surface antigen BspA-like [Chaetoceros tenuissimus]
MGSHLVLPGVEIIPEFTFFDCINIETVFMDDIVRRIEKDAFSHCTDLAFIKLSRNLEYVGQTAFWSCDSLTSIFIPQSCRAIGEWAFQCCKKLIIVSIPQNVQLGRGVFECTALIKKSPLQLDGYGGYDEEHDEEAVQWFRSINNDEIHSLHRACSCFNPLSEIIHDLVKRLGIDAMRMKNSIGITPSQYLEANTFTTISEKEIINRYILDSSIEWC